MGEKRDGTAAGIVAGLARWIVAILVIGAIGVLLHRFVHSNWLAMLINAWLQP